jgi:serine/threonine protein kinase
MLFIGNFFKFYLKFCFIKVLNINFLFSLKLIFSDIKGKNIMVMGNGVVKLIDFGCAKRLKKNQSSNSIKQLLKSLKGKAFIFLESNNN